MEKPLVSIVVTFWNGAQFLDRALTSAINQTYRNIEIVALDDASTDESAAIIKKYAQKDPRIKYFKNEKNIGYSLSLAKLPELAKGKYVQLLGGDDWLARDYVEIVVKLLEADPDAACVAAKIVTLDLLPDNQFHFVESFLPTKRKMSRNFYIRHVYKTDLGATFTPQALFRREDFLESGAFLREVFTNPPIPIPEDLRKLHLKGHATGTLFLLKVIHKYKHLILTDETAYIKTQNFRNENKPYNSIIDWTSAGRILRSYYFDRLDFEPIFKTVYKKFWTGYRLFFAAEPFASMFFVFIKKRFPKNFFSDLKAEDIRTHLANYSLLEKCAAVLFLPIRLGVRLFGLAKRPFDTSRKRNINVFRANNFLNSEGRFSTEK
jgi:glycosyltransferase involved in cell wall biosynthesis